MWVRAERKLPLLLEFERRSDALYCSHMYLPESYLIKYSTYIPLVDNVLCEVYAESFLDNAPWFLAWKYKGIALTIGANRIRLRGMTMVDMDNEYYGARF